VGLQVVERGTDLSINGGRIILSSDKPKGDEALEELCSKEARDFALNAASRRGVASARVGGMSRPYPVDQEGQPVIDQLAQGVASYRVDIPISSSLL
jgi:hypothetical protein